MSTEQFPSTQDSLVITPGPKKIFNVEIHLSEAQLRWICENDGDEDFEYINDYDQITAARRQNPIDPDPSYNLGLGAEINDLVSFAFLVLSRMHEAQFKTKINLEDLSFHSFRNLIPLIKSVDYDMLDCEIKHPYHMITMAVDRTSGQQITIDEAIAKKNQEK